MNRLTLRILAFLVLAAAFAGLALCAPPVIRQPPEARRAGPPPGPATPASVNASTNPPATLKPEDALWLSARESLRFQQYADARRKFEQFGLQYGKDQRLKEALFYQGLCQLNLGQDFQALNIWDRLVQREMSEHARSEILRLTLEQLVLYHERKGAGAEYAKALKQLQLAFPEHETTVTLYRLAAEKKMAARDYPGALEFYQALAGKLTEQDRRNMELARKLGSASSQEPGQALALANASLAKNEVDLAIDLYQLCLAQNPESAQGAEARTNLGWCHNLQGRYAEAEKLWKEVVANTPAKSPWRGQSRWHLIQLNTGPYNKSAAAIALCDEQAREFTGQFMGEQALLVKAWIYWSEKRWAEAQTGFQALIAACPEKAAHPPIQRYLRDCAAGLQPTKGKLR